jgi:pilus assembly protein Flp/PilA
MKKLINFFKDEEGATMVEYGIMVALIAAVCITIIKTLGTQVNTAFTNTSTALGS